MPGDQSHGFAEQADAGRDPVPGRSAGWMRQRDYFEGATVAADLETAPNDFVQFFKHEELRDRKFADGDDEPRLQKIDLIIHPGRAIPDLVRRRNAVAARSRFPRETAADGREINLRAHFHFIQVTEFLEPAEERPARGPGEGPAEHRLFHAGRLADQHDFAQDGSARYWRRQHSRTAPALEQTRDMLIQQLLRAGGPRHSPLLLQGAAVYKPPFSLCRRSGGRRSLGLHSGTAVVGNLRGCTAALPRRTLPHTMAVQFRDYYETLGVSKTATDDEIRKAFRKLARKYHPDVNKDKATAEEKFKQLNEAYEVLGDPEKRKKYDELGANWNQPGGISAATGMGRATGRRRIPPIQHRRGRRGGV